MPSTLRALLVALACLAAPAARADLVVSVDLTGQTMTVTKDGTVRHRWPISSGREGYRTPNGTYRPQRLERMHYSRQYDWSPMPHSIFFRGGYAIHGTGAVGRLGRTASHGCIRLSPGNAAQLFRLVQGEGPDRTRIVVSGNAALADARARGRTARASAGAAAGMAERPAGLATERPARAALARRNGPSPVYVYEYVSPYGYAQGYQAVPAGYGYRYR